MEDPPDGVADTGGGLDNSGVIMKSSAIEDGGGAVENSPCMVGEPGKVSSLVGYFDRNKADHAASLSIDASSDDNMLDHVEAQVLNNSPIRIVSEETPADSRDGFEPELETHLNPTTSPVISLLEPDEPSNSTQLSSEPDLLPEYPASKIPYDTNFRKSLISSTLLAKTRFTPYKTRALPLTFKARRLISYGPISKTEPSQSFLTIEFPNLNTTHPFEVLPPDKLMLEADPGCQNGAEKEIAIPRSGVWAP